MKQQPENGNVWQFVTGDVLEQVMLCAHALNRQQNQVQVATLQNVTMII
jgi:hypothetical protein